MHKTRLTILPILGVIFAIFFGWSTTFGQAAEKLEQEFKDIMALPSGSLFTLTISDDEVTEAANEYLVRYMDEIVDLLQQMTGMKLDISRPEVEFRTDESAASLRVGKGFMKVPASVRASVYWENGTIVMDVKSIDVPTISVDPATVNGYIQKPINDGTEYISQYLDIQSFKVCEGYIELVAIKK